MKEYRITKYNPDQRNSQGFYMLDDWTDWSDIGKVYNKKVFVVDEYLKTEEKYIAIVKMIVFRKRIDVIQIKHLEMPFDDADIVSLIKTMKEKKLNMRKEDMALYDEIGKGKKKIHYDEIASIIRLLLRGFLWCELTYKKRIKIYTGYDFYMYINCDEITIDIINFERNNEMYIEDMDEVRKKYSRF